MEVTTSALKIDIVFNVTSLHIPPSQLRHLLHPHIYTPPLHSRGSRLSLRLVAGSATCLATFPETICENSTRQCPSTLSLIITDAPFSKNPLFQSPRLPSVTRQKVSSTSSPGSDPPAQAHRAGPLCPPFSCSGPSSDPDPKGSMLPVWQTDIEIARRTMTCSKASQTPAEIEHH